MRSAFHRLAALTGLTLILVSATSCAGFYDTPAAKTPSKILNDRILLTLPKNSKVKDLYVKGEKSVELERSRIEFSKGKQRLRIEVRELFAFRADNFASRLSTDVRKAFHNPVGVRYRIDQKDRNRFMVTPSKFFVHKGYTLIRAMYFVNFDNTVISLAVYGNKPARSEEVKLINLAETVLNSIKPGKRKLNIKPRTVKLVSHNRLFEMKLKLPKRFLLSVRHDKKNKHYHIHKLNPVGKRRLEIRVSMGPEPHITQKEKGDIKQTKYKSRVLGRRVGWSKIVHSNQSQFHALKTILALHPLHYADEERKTYVTLFLHSGSNKNLKRLIALAGRIRVTKEPSFDTSRIVRTNPPSNNQNGVNRYGTHPDTNGQKTDPNGAQGDRDTTRRDPYSNRNTDRYSNRNRYSRRDPDTDRYRSRRDEFEDDFDSRGHRNDHYRDDDRGWNDGNRSDRDYFSTPDDSYLPEYY